MRASFVAVAAIAAVSLLAGCAAGTERSVAGMTPGTTSSTPTSSTSTTTVAPPPSAEQPYPFGEPQAKVPATVGGKAPVVRRIDTTKPYVFITIDDGAERDPHALQLIKESGARPTLFLNEKYVKGHEDYFKQLQDQDNLVIGNHTVNHPDLVKMPYAAQKKEICDDSDAFAKAFGQRPTLFRPPFGDFNADTQRAAADCGLKAVILWTAAVNDGVVQFQGGNKLKPGDIVLMHFRKTFVEDFTAFLKRAKQDGLVPVPLPDFLS